MRGLFPTGLAILATTIAPLLSMAQTAIATVPVGNTPVAVAANPVTHKIYVVNHGSSSVTIIDGTTHASSTVSVEDRPEAVVVNPVTNKIYVTNAGADSVSVIDGATNVVSATVHVGSYPQALAVNTATNKIYAANNFGHSVTVIDGATNATTTIQVGQGPTRYCPQRRNQQGVHGQLREPGCNRHRCSDWGYYCRTGRQTPLGNRSGHEVGQNLCGQRRQRQRDDHRGDN
jgi:YVTN family beta-propeller protein